MNWFEAIKKYYQNGLWNEAMMKNAVAKGKITPQEYQEITGKVLPEEVTV